MKFDLPELKDGEIYAGAIINPDGTGNHIVLLDGELADSEWDDAMAWAKKQGGDLPNRVEQAILFANLKDDFEERAYWSSEQHASYSDYAWSQRFSQRFYGGTQDYWTKASPLQARAVRRILVI
jgi:hypothetical protein